MHPLAIALSGMSGAAGVTDETPLYLVTLDELPPVPAIGQPPVPGGTPSSDSEVLFAALRRELQSVNEELATVDTELQTKVTDLSQANSDMSNRHGGHIGLVSKLGTGTTFTFYLPASPPPLPAEAKPPASW